MESLVGQILNGNNIVLGCVVFFLWYLRKEDIAARALVTTAVLEEMKNLTTAINGLTKDTAVHANELENGNKRFEKLEKDNTIIREHLHDIKGTMLTEDQINIILEKS